MKADEASLNVNNAWELLASRYSDDRQLVGQISVEILNAYSSTGRHYHNTDHLNSLIRLSDEFRLLLKDKDAIDFAIFFHDFYYDPTRSDNEELSAVKSAKTLRKLSIDEEKIRVVSEYVLATKSHNLQYQHSSPDLAWFLDFDLSVLSASPEDYSLYTEQVRKEYSLFPDPVWNEGRRRFIEKMLKRKSIYLTDHFRSHNELQARHNLTTELQSLTS